MRTFLEFTIEGAHSVAGFSGLHGHTFVVKLSFEGEPDPVYGWSADLYAVKKIANRIREEVGPGDESGDGAGEGNLNELAGMRVVTLENLARWVWTRVAPHHPSLVAVEVNRGFRGSIEGCEYRAPALPSVPASAGSMTALA